MLYKSGAELSGVEIKAASTWHPGFRKGLDRFSATVHALHKRGVVFNGEPFRASDGLEALPVGKVAEWVVAG